MSTKAKSKGGEPAAARKRMSAPARRELIEAAATELFSERGYYATSIDEIAKRSGVTPPVLYDHFESKQDLYRRLLEGHFAGLRRVWRENLPGSDPPAERIAQAVDAWFAYVQAHPFAARMLFRDTTGDPTIAAMHEQVMAASRAEMLPMITGDEGIEGFVGNLSETGVEMIWVVLRGVLQGLAMWWDGHPEVPREQLVATAMASLWFGYERSLSGNVEQ